MDVACNIGFTSGEHLALDGWDEILFLNEVPYIEVSFNPYYKISFFLYSFIIYIIPKLSMLML